MPAASGCIFAVAFSRLVSLSATVVRVSPKSSPRVSSQSTGLPRGESKPSSNSYSFSKALDTSKRCRQEGTYSTVAVSKMDMACCVCSEGSSKVSASGYDEGYREAGV